MQMIEIILKSLQVARWRGMGTIKDRKHLRSMPAVGQNYTAHLCLFVLSYLRAFFVSLHSYHILANSCSEKAMLVLALNTILRDTEKNPVFRRSLLGSKNVLCEKE